MTFRGNILEIPLGGEGLTGNANQSQIRPAQLLRATNLTYEAGTLQKEGGSIKYNSTALTGTPTIIGGWDWDHDGVSQRAVIVTDAGDYLKDSGGGTFGDTLASGLTTSGAVPVFVEGGKEGAAVNRKLFLFTGQNAVQVLDGDAATSADLTTPPTDWSTGNPTFGFNHEQRVWGGGNSNDPHRGYYSTPDGHEDFTGAGSGTLPIYPGEGEKLVGGLSFRDRIVWFKFPVGIYVSDTSASDAANWRTSRLTQEIGLAGPNAWAIANNDVVFMDVAGNIHALSAVLEFGSFKDSAVSEGVAEMGEFTRRNINVGALGGTHCVFYEARRELHWTVPSIGSTVANRRLVLDINRPDLGRFRWSDKDDAVSIWLRKDTNDQQKPAVGDDVGFVWLLDQAVKSKDGVGYTGEFQTPQDDFSRLDTKLATIRKNGRFLELVVEPQGNWDLSVDVLWDNELQETITFNMGVSGAALGTFVLGTDRLADEQVLNKKRRITGGGRRFSMVGRQGGAAQDFSVARAFLHFVTGDERL